MNMKKSNILELKSNIKKIVTFLGFVPVLLMTSCHNDRDINSIEFTSYPKNIISTPIIMSDFPKAVAESQTPINIIPSKAVTFHSNMPIIHYGVVTLDSVVNVAGEELKININNTDNLNNYITVEGKRYNLVSLHFHYSSEHTIDGMYSTMEIHFVNIAVDNSYLVLSIMVDLGNGNPSLENLFAQSPTMSDAVNSPNIPFNISNLLPDNTREYYTYSGSLTTPNFGVNSSITNGGPVTWFVLKNKQQLSTAQFNSYKAIYPAPNFRHIQPMNGRVVYFNPGF
ncbi:Carbonic anhydrase [Chryseobacterium potabilaquae]|uniref:Carbonic anhydrase n=2 Tax=Chryseobacterium potabilaquae TaxID=2675057 RepID=A0A6N4X627_9FLAO|nr:Carbonic anhydrase [Chryseobacterium potabilaquae]